MLVSGSWFVTLNPLAKLRLAHLPLQGACRVPRYAWPSPPTRGRAKIVECWDCGELITSYFLLFGYENFYFLFVISYLP